MPQKNTNIVSLDSDNEYVQIFGKRYDIIPSSDTTYIRSRRFMFTPSYFTANQTKIHKFVMSYISQKYESESRPESDVAVYNISLMDIALKTGIDEAGYVNEKRNPSHIYDEIYRYVDIVNDGIRNHTYRDEETGNVFSLSIIGGMNLISKCFTDEQKKVYDSFGGPFIEVKIINTPMLALANNFVLSDMLYIKDMESNLGIKLYDYLLADAVMLDVKKLVYDIKRMSQWQFRFLFLINLDDDYIASRIDKQLSSGEKIDETFYRNISDAAKRRKKIYSDTLKNETEEDERKKTYDKWFKIYPYDHIGPLNLQVEKACKCISEYTNLHVEYEYDRKTKEMVFTYRKNHKGSIDLALTKKQVAFQKKFETRMFQTGSQYIGSAAATEQHRELMSKICVSADEMPMLDKDIVEPIIDMQVLERFFDAAGIKELVTDTDKIDVTDNKQLSRLCGQLLAEYPDITSEEIRRAVARMDDRIKNKKGGNITTTVAKYLRGVIKNERAKGSL